MSAGGPPPNSQGSVYKRWPTEGLLTRSCTQIIEHTHTHTDSIFNKVFSDGTLCMEKRELVSIFLCVCICMYICIWGLKWRCGGFFLWILPLWLFAIKPACPEANRATDMCSQMPTGSLIPCVSGSLPLGLVMSLLCWTGHSGPSSPSHTPFTYSLVSFVAYIQSEMSRLTPMFAVSLSPPCLFSLHCLSCLLQAFPLCWGSDRLGAVWYVWYSVVLVLDPVN